jgi:hypothetical protein
MSGQSLQNSSKLTRKPYGAFRGMATTSSQGKLIVPRALVIAHDISIGRRSIAVIKRHSLQRGLLCIA